MSSIEVVGGFVSIIPESLIKVVEEDMKVRGKPTGALSFSQIMNMMNQPSELLFGGKNLQKIKDPSGVSTEF